MTIEETEVITQRLDAAEEMAGHLRKLHGYLYHADDPVEWEDATKALRGVHEVLKRNALGSLASLPPEELMNVAVDMLLMSGELRRPLLLAIVAAIREWPLIVGTAKVAAWYPDATFEEWRLLAIRSNGRAEAVGRVWLEDGRWHWESYGNPSDRGDESDCDVARALVGLRLPGLVVLETIPTPHQRGGA